MKTNFIKIIGLIVTIIVITACGSSSDSSQDEEGGDGINGTSAGTSIDASSSPVITFSEITNGALLITIPGELLGLTDSEMDETDLNIYRNGQLHVGDIPLSSQYSEEHNVSAFEIANIQDGDEISLFFVFPSGDIIAFTGTIYDDKESFAKFDSDLDSLPSSESGGESVSFEPFNPCEEDPYSCLDKDGDGKVSQQEILCAMGYQEC